MHTKCSTYLLYIAYHTPRPVKLVPRPPRPAFVACTASLQYKRQKLKAKSIASHSNDYTTTRHDVTVAPSAQLLPFPNTPSLHPTPRHTPLPISNTPSLHPTPRHTPFPISNTPSHHYYFRGWAYFRETTVVIYSRVRDHVIVVTHR